MTEGAVDEYGMTAADHAEIADEMRQHESALLRRLVWVVLFGSRKKGDARSFDYVNGRWHWILGACVALVALALRRGFAETAWRDAVEVAYINAGSDYWGEAVGETLVVNVRRCRAWRDSV